MAVIAAKNNSPIPVGSGMPAALLEFHLLDTGHFALEEDGNLIAGHIRKFLTKHVDQ